MTAADKCHLNIPFKETARSDLRLDADGSLDPDALKRFGAREFENYKAIERRINDPDCGGEGCTPVTIIAESNTKAAGGSTIGLTAQTSFSTSMTSYSTLDSTGGTWTFSGGGDGFHPPVSGLYFVTCSLILAHVSGSSNIYVSPYITAQNPLGSSWDWFGGTYTPADFPARSSVSALVACTAGVGGDGFIPTVILQAPTSSTRTMTFGMLKVAAMLVCGT